MDLIDKTSGNTEDDNPFRPSSKEEEEAIDTAIAAAEEEIKEEKEEAELEEGFEEEEKLFPEEPVIYHGVIWAAVDIFLVIDYKTKQVSGKLTETGNHYTDAVIEGTIDIETFEIKSTFSGTMGSVHEDEDVPFNGTIDGTVSEDLKTFDGTLEEDKGDEGIGGAFTATTIK
jgi:hypothetical protein